MMEDLFRNNRRRFNEIHADRRFPFLDKVYYQLSINDDKLTDEEIISSYFKFSDCIQTNTFAAAELEWVTISVLCFYRRHLTPLLIQRGILSIIYSWGDELTALDILSFINLRILADAAEPYGGLPPESGIHWLKDILPNQEELLQQSLDDMIKQG